MVVHITYLAHTIVDYGVTTTFVDPLDVKNFEDAIQDNTKALYIETLGNPNSEVADIESYCKDCTCSQHSACN